MSLSLAENVIVAGANNRPPMLDKTNYSSWEIRMLLYIKGKEHGKLLVDSVLNGPFQYGTMVEPGNETTLAMIRARTYTDLTDEEKISESFDIKATNIVLQGLPQDIYNLVTHNEDAKQIWDRVKLLIQGSELSLQEQHEAHANEVRLQRKRYPDQIALLDSGLVVPSFNPFDDLIANLNKLMTFVSTSFGPRFPQINNQLRTSSNPRNQATIQEGRVTIQTTDDLDAFDSDCDDVPSAKAILMVNLSSYDSDVLLEVPFHDTNMENDMSYQSVQETQCSEQSFIDNDTEIDITSDSNIISYEQYLQENENPVVQNINSSAQQDELLIVVIEEMSSQVAKYNMVQQENLIVYETLTAELERYKEQVKLFEQRHKLDLNDRENDYLNDVNARVKSKSVKSRSAKSKKKKMWKPTGLPKLKFKKDHLCSACFRGKIKKSSHKPKAGDTNQEKLYLLHMNLCGPMRVESINGKKYILVIVDDYSRFTWVKVLRSKDESPEVIIKCLKQIQVRMNATVRNIRTGNGTEFVNQTLKDYYENVRILHQTFVARTPQQNDVVKKRNRTLVKAARTILIFSKAPLFL
ncbi:retrovirus-related pol polyprotein from transposon TNT 1-94 [Tanacetum coccineum]